MLRSTVLDIVRSGLKATLLIAVCCLTGYPVHSQDATILPSRGRVFWTGFMQNGFGAQSLKVHVVANGSTTGTVSIPGTGWSAAFSVSANGVAVVDVPTSAEHSGSETVQNKGVLIQSQDSVNVFISSFQNFTHDMSQLLPLSSLGSSYRVDSYQGLPNFNNLHKSELLVVATEDGTQVRITPSVNTLGGRPAGSSFTVNLNMGQSYQVQAATDVLDLTGTVVEATATSGSCRPFVVLGGSMCATVPGSCSACDAIFEQLIPRSAWGTRYFTVPVQGVTTTTYRVLADENNTTVTIGNGAPFVLNAGQRYEVNGNTAPVCIQANKPVSVAQLLEGYSCAGNGDPSLILLAPAARMSTKALLHTPTSSQINQHSISVVIPASGLGQLTLNGNPVNTNLFQPYPGCADRMHARFPIPAGVHRLQSPSGFQAYVFGLGYGESYAAGVQDIKAVSIPQDSVVCGSGTITLSTPELLSSISWTAASAPSTILGTGTSLIVTPTTSESYTVTGVVPSSGCSRSFTYHVGVPLTIPTLPMANNGPATAVCQFEAVQLGLNPPPDPAWFQIQWSPANTLSDPNISNPIATPQEDTWYTVSVTSPSGCGAMVDSVFVGVTPAQILELSVSTLRSELCLNDSTLLNSKTLRVIGQDRFEVAGNALWDAIQGASLSNVCGSFSGNALYFNGNGQRFARTVAMNTTGGGRIRFHLKIADGMAPCQNADPGEDVVLEYSTNNGLTWSTIATYPENAYPAFTAIDQAIPAAAQASNAMFRLRQLANSGAGQDNWAIDDFMLARYDNTWLSYSWDPGSVNSPNAPSTTAFPTASGWYTLTGTDPLAGCQYQDSVYIHVDPAFNLTVTNDTTLCNVAGLQLQATPSFQSTITYLWGPSNGSLSATNIPAPTATPQTTTTYTVQASTASGCTASGSVTVQVGQLIGLAVSASNDTLCQGQSAQLTAAANGGTGLNYAWTGSGLSNATISAPIAQPTQTTTYSVTVTDIASGCSLSESITIVVNTGYTANVGADLNLCSALGQVLGVQHNVPGATYSWAPAANLNAANIQSPTILADVSATYTVTVTDANGCSVSDQVAVTRAFNGLPAQSTAVACANVPPTLSAPQTGSSYLWSTGANTPSIVPTASGNYTLTITDAQGCEGITTFVVSLFPLPVVDLGPDQSLCGASSHVLNAGNTGSTVMWNTGASGSQLTVTANGIYTATVTNGNNCVASDAIEVQFLAMPTDVLQDMTACISTPPTLNAGNAGSNFLWNTGATSQSISATDSGSYSVVVTTAANCSATFEASVTLAPMVQVALGNDTSICEGASVLLDAGLDPGTVLWNTGSTSRTISVQQAGAYEVSLSNGFCSASDAITVALLPSPSNALQNVTTCSDNAVTLDAGNPGSSYLWSNGANSRTISPTSDGSYTVSVTNAEGCSASFTATVVLVPPPMVELGMDTVLCEGQVLILDGANPGSNYLWSTGANSSTLQVQQAGTYSVVVSNSQCQRSDAITVLFNPSPSRMATRQHFTCLDEAPGRIYLDAGNPGSTFLWSTGSTHQITEADTYGWYSVEITNMYQCSVQDSTLVSEFCPSTMYVPNTFTPDGDGLNDEFIPVGKNIASMQLLIFDRWGTLLFESNDPNVGWNGRYRGEVVMNDMYMWRLTYRFLEDVNGRLGPEKQMMGHVQVLR